MEQGLPPGLWLPTATESTEQYRRDVFNHSSHTYEEIVDYGAFMVALAVMGVSEHPRTSYMPTRADMIAMNEAGYGVTPKILSSHYGGLTRLQQSLGFFPRRYHPPLEELTARLKWMAGYALDLEADFDEPTKSVKDVIWWGATRDLLPSREIVYDVLGRDTCAIQKVFAIEKPNARKQVSYLDLYRFGAKVIAKNDGPIMQEELDERYGQDFIEKPHFIIHALWGSAGKFWLEFGYVPNSRAFNRNQLVNLGIQLAIKTGGAPLTVKTISQLSKSQKFPSMQPIIRLFGGPGSFNQEVAQGYEAFLNTRRKLGDQGVSCEMANLACANFDPTAEFEAGLLAHIPELAVLSAQSEEAKYVRRIIGRGFDLESETFYNWQVADVNTMLKKLGLVTDAQKRFVSGLIPRFKAQNLEQHDTAK
jgi:hypothetical protein